MTAGWSGTTAGVAVCALLPLLSIGLAGVSATSSGISEQPKGLISAPITAAEVQEQFMEIVRLANKLYNTTQDKDNSIVMLRTAYKLCPTCPMTQLAELGDWSRGVFFLDGFEDRRVLYGQILPEIYNSNIKDLLWIGVEPYNLRMEFLLAKQGISMTSLEINPEQAPFGSSFRHIVAPVQDLGLHVADKSFDAVVINGVFGWGVNSAQDVGNTMLALHDVLRDHGLLLVGYNKPIGFSYWTSGLGPLFDDVALGQLAHQVDLSSSETHHVYEFFRKSAALSNNHVSGSRRRRPELSRCGDVCNNNET